VVLAVGWIEATVGFSEETVPAGTYEKPGLLQVAVFAGNPVELDEGHLDLFVPVYGGSLPVFFGAEHVADVVGEADGHTEETLLARGPEVGHGGLQEVARAVHLVQVEVRPALVGPLAREVRVEVAVAPLGVCYLGYGGVHHPLKVRVRVRGEGPRGRFEPLVYVRVVEVEAPERCVQLAGDTPEVIQTAGLLDVLVLRAERLLPVMRLRGSQKRSVSRTSLSGRDLKRA
jgi:hypothetical protein